MRLVKGLIRKWVGSMSTKSEQQAICQKYGSEFISCSKKALSGISANITSGKMPLNGLRHPMTESSTGWYIWAGDEMSQESDFFQPQHINHIISVVPEIEKYLCLAPGWRFLIDPTQDYVDVWYDESLLDV